MIQILIISAIFLLSGYATYKSIIKKNVLYSVHELHNRYYISKKVGNRILWLSKYPENTSIHSIYDVINKKENPIKFTKLPEECRYIEARYVRGQRVFDYKFKDYQNIQSNAQMKEVDRYNEYLFACMLVDIFSGVYKNKVIAEQRKHILAQEKVVNKIRADFKGTATPKYSVGKTQEAKITVVNKDYRDEILRLTPLLIQADEENDMKKLDELLVEFANLKA